MEFGFRVWFGSVRFGSVWFGLAMHGHHHYKRNPTVEKEILFMLVSFLPTSLSLSLSLISKKYYLFIYLFIYFYMEQKIYKKSFFLRKKLKLWWDGL